jgi:hypothetical protein
MIFFGYLALQTQQQKNLITHSDSAHDGESEDIFILIFITISGVLAYFLEKGPFLSP